MRACRPMQTKEHPAAYTKDAWTAPLAQRSPMLGKPESTGGRPSTKGILPPGQPGTLGQHPRHCCSVFGRWGRPNW
jgi:hypothetical protein